MSIRLPLLFATVLAAVSLAGAVPSKAEAGGPPYRYAFWAHVDYRWAICAQDLWVRHSPGGPGFARLYKPQTFLVKGFSDWNVWDPQWVYGFAYGNVNRWGWVQNGWFCGLP
jgi:hypothetical protein